MRLNRLPRFYAYYSIDQPRHRPDVSAAALENATTFLAAQRPNSALQTLRDMINTHGLIAGPR